MCFAGRDRSAAVPARVRGGRLGERGARARPVQEPVPRVAALAALRAPHGRAQAHLRPQRHPQPVQVLPVRHAAHLDLSAAHLPIIVRLVFAIGYSLHSRLIYLYGLGFICHNIAFHSF